jgi:hypothetical protein
MSHFVWLASVENKGAETPEFFSHERLVHCTACKESWDLHSILIDATIRQYDYLAVIVSDSFDGFVTDAKNVIAEPLWSLSSWER